MQACTRVSVYAMYPTPHILACPLSILHRCSHVCMCWCACVGVFVCVGVLTKDECVLGVLMLPLKLALSTEHKCLVVADVCACRPMTGTYFSCCHSSLRFQTYACNPPFSIGMCVCVCECVRADQGRPRHLHAAIPRPRDRRNHRHSHPGKA